MDLASHHLLLETGLAYSKEIHGDLWDSLSCSKTPHQAEVSLQCFLNIKGQDQFTFVTVCVNRLEKT